MIYVDEWHAVALQDVAQAAGGLSKDVQAVLVGGYFGGWAPADEIWSVSLNQTALQARKNFHRRRQLQLLETWNLVW